MNDAEGLTEGCGRAVGVVQALGGLGDELDGDRHGELLVEPPDGVQETAQGTAAYQLHDEVEGAVLGAPELEGVHHVRARDVRREAGLVEEHRDELRVVGQVRQHPLDRDQLLEAALAKHARRMDLGHAARRDTEQELVTPEGTGLRRLGLRAHPR